MCGIVGLAGDFAPDLARPAISRGLELIRHRGPDEDVEVSLEPGCYLGMTRLAIRDLHRGLYPTSDCSRTAFSVFNGEIYNADILAKRLGEGRHTLRSNTDGEVIPHLYEETGIDGLKDLKGMFALALWDSDEQILVLQRDRVGIKPLYYTVIDRGLIFASEVKALVGIRAALGRTNSVTLHPDAVEALTRAMFMPSWQETAFVDIQQVPPGYQLIWSQGNVSVRDASSLEPATETVHIEDHQDLVIETRRLLQESVARHLVSDVPVSIALSGGIDSSLLAAVAVEQGADLDAFTVTFTGDSRSEGSQAAAFAKRLGIRMSEVELDPGHIADNFDEHIDLYMDLSTLDGGAISTSLMSAAMRQRGFRVGLFGEGADEVFGGYTWFGLSSGAYRLLPERLRRRAWWYANTREWRAPTEEAGTSWRHQTSLDWISTQELRIQLPNHLLVKIDRGTMAHGLEGRVPYLDDDLLTWVRSVPSRFRTPKIKLGLFPDPSRTKPLLRDVAEAYLGKVPATTPKKGFMLPLDTVVHRSQERIADLVNSGDSVTRSMLPRKVIAQLNSPLGWTSMSVNMTWMMWRVLVIESVCARWRSGF